MTRGPNAWAVWGVAVVCPLWVSGQTITGRVVDPMNAPVPGAKIVLSGGGTERTVQTGSQGEFRADGRGSYELRVAVRGFEPVRRRVLADGKPMVIRLVLAQFDQELTVPGEERVVAAQAGQNADAISVERGLLDTLPILDNDYLNAFARFLDPGLPGGMGASLIVDGMEMRNAGVTPSAIQEIKINNNPYTAEYPRWSRRRIEVITKSSADAYHGTVNFLFRDGALNARDALAAQKPQEQRRVYEGSLFGPVGRSKRTSFLLSGAREDENLVAIVYAEGPNGLIQANVPAPRVNTLASLRVTHQLNEGQAIFGQYNFQDTWTNNSGVGGTVLAEAGMQNRFREDELIFNHRGVIRKNLLSQFRVLVGRYWAPWHSNVNAAKAVVTDAFTGGGAQGDRLQTEFHASMTWLLTQTIGRHTLKYGINIPDWSRRGLSDWTNQIGTLSFASLADFSAGRPFAAVLQRGNPTVVFVEKNVGGFMQDEWQMRPGLSMAVGVRYDWQNSFDDLNNIAPRLSIAWAPGKQRQTVLRAGAGFFFDRAGPQPIWDVMRYNGTYLRRYVLSGAQIPEDPRGFPSSVAELQSGIQLADAMQFSVGYERQLTRKTTLAVNYVGTRTVQLLRSRDANAPLPPAFAARPNPSANVQRMIESAGRLESNALEVTVRGDLARRLSGLVQYAYGKTMNDTGGLNWYPAASYGPRGERGRADGDRRHAFNAMVNATLHPWLNLGIAVSLGSGIPFNITTGRDENKDGMALERPPGITRNTGKGPGLAVVDVRWYHEFRFRPARKDKSPSVVLAADAFNVLNHVNYVGYVGALTSPFFGQAVATQPARRFQLGLKLQF